MLNRLRSQVHHLVWQVNRFHQRSIINLEIVMTIALVVMPDWTRNYFTMPNMNQYMTNRHIQAASIIQVMRYPMRSLRYTFKIT